jgi:hypothetical protein
MYIDESGGDEPGSTNVFVLGGVVAFERVPFHVCSDADNIQQEFFPGTSTPVEFRASAVWNGNGEPWNSMALPERKKFMARMYDFIASREELTLFGIPMHKASFPSDHPIQRTCEEMAGHFDKYLENFEIEKPHHGKQRGLMIFDQSKHEKTVQALMSQYRTTGASFGRIKRLAEVPLFTDSKITRMLQLADFVAYALFRSYEKSDNQFLNRLLKRFHQRAGKLHGLFHLTSKHDECYCPACLSRRS